MKPLVAIVGRPNVGKSMLFNKLIGQRLSIVEDTPGVTRDRIYGESEWCGRKFRLVDTGGIEPRTDDQILSFMREQAEIAIQHADVIIFLTDVKTGLTASDQEVANMLLRSHKPIVLAVNKMDSTGRVDPDFYEFYNLGLGDPIAVSAVHGHGTGDLLDACLQYFPPEDDEEEEDIPDLPEPPAEETLADLRAQLSSATRACRAVGILTLLMWLGQLAAHFSLMPALYWDDPMVRTLPYLALELLACILGRHVFLDAFRKARGGRVTSPLLTFILCVVTLADTALYAFLPARAALSAPLPAIAVLSLYGALLGETQRLHGLYDTFRIAAIGNAPYIVTVTAGGAAKRTGLPAGFSNAARAGDPYSRWQNALLPVLLVASIVFAVLATLESKQRVLLLWNLSVLLASANLPALPMTCALPFKRIAARLAKSGSAVAGYAGADAIRRSNCVILTDGDLFPPGTVTLGGLKVFGEESGKVISYAATMAHASESGLTKLFDDLLMRDGGFRERVEDVDFYEEGGVGGRIHGETVLFGTMGFMRKRGVNLPRNLGLKTGVFLSVDGTLIAVFAVKYMPAENVDWALHALHHSRITPVLAVRDGNITPALLKRKFGTDARAVYPKMSTRLALSERGGGRPYALLMREGLMPYAEVVLGSKRLCRSARRCTVLAFVAATLATLLAFYLTFVGAYSVLTPLSLLVFVLLWSLSALLDALLSDRY